MILAIHIGGQKCGEIMETEKQCDARCRDSSQFLAKKWESYYGKLSYEVMGYQWGYHVVKQGHMRSKGFSRGWM
jgi:hypothetical protein